jgi:hypothetical protein
MPKSLQELSDRLEIQDLQAAYSNAIDTRDFDALDRLTKDAFIDWRLRRQRRRARGDEGSCAALAMFAGFQHMVATSQVTLAGNRATAKTICWNPMVLKGAPGSRASSSAGSGTTTISAHAGRLAHHEARRGEVLHPQHAGGVHEPRGGDEEPHQRAREARGAETGCESEVRGEAAFGGEREGAHRESARRVTMTTRNLPRSARRVSRNGG